MNKTPKTTVALALFHASSFHTVTPLMKNAVGYTFNYSIKGRNGMLGTMPNSYAKARNQRANMIAAKAAACYTGRAETIAMVLLDESPEDFKGSVRQRMKMFVEKLAA